MNHQGAHFMGRIEKTPTVRTLPVVLLHVDELGGVEVLQSSGVVVAIINERNPRNRGCVLPVTDRTAEIMNRLHDVPLVGDGTDIAEQAKAALRKPTVSESAPKPKCQHDWVDGVCARCAEVWHGPTPPPMAAKPSLAKDLEARIAELEARLGEVDGLSATTDICIDRLRQRAETAEARVVELEGILQATIDGVDCQPGYIRDHHIQAIRAALQPRTKEAGE